jgi:hypothetical protein
MSKVVSAVGLALCSLGVWQGISTYAFVQRADLVQGRVTGVQELRGPPKPRQKTPINILYTDTKGMEVSAVAHLPMLQQIQTGDEIRVLIDPLHPGDARLPLWSELWARSLTYIIGGLLIAIVGRVLRQKHLR